MVNRLKSRAGKLPILLLLGMICVFGTFGGAWAQEIFWTDASGNRFTADTLNLQIGQKIDVLLKAQIPANKTLGSVAITTTYPGANLTLFALNKTTDLSWIVTNPTAFPDGSGTFKVGGVSNAGIPGGTAGKTITLVGLTLYGQAEGAGTFAIAVDEYVDDANAAIPITPANLTLNVTGLAVGENEVYWTDLAGVRLSDVSLVVGEQQWIRLKAGVPTGKTLGAFKFTLTYNTNVIEVLEPKTTPDKPWRVAELVFPPETITINHNTPGVIITNGITTATNLVGPAVVSFIDVLVKAKAVGVSPFTIEVNNFGASATDEFIPAPTTSNANFRVTGIQAAEAYWADQSGARMPGAFNLPVGVSQTFRLMTTVPATKTLNAYNFVLGYSAASVSLNSAVASPGSLFPPANINTNTPGQIIINGFDTTGVKGGALIALIDVTLTGTAEGTFNLSINPAAYGSSATEQFIPTATPVSVTVGDGVIPGPVFYTVSFTAGANGRLEGNLQQTVEAGTSTTAVTAVPDAGFKFEKWTITRFGDTTSTESTVNPFVMNNVDFFYTITASFVKDQYILTYKAGDGGRVEGQLNQLVGHGQNAAPVEAFANQGCSLVNWTASDGKVYTTNPLTVENVTSDAAIQANFDCNPNLPGPWTVVFSAGAGGTVEGILAQSVINGGKTTAVTAKPGTLLGKTCTFLGWTGSNGFVSTANPLELLNVTENIEIKANFDCDAEAPGPWIVNFLAAAGGRVEGDLAQVVQNNGAATAVTAVAEGEGCEFRNWTDASGTVYSDNPIVLQNVAANMTLTANFNCPVQQWTVKFVAGPKGRLEGDLNQTVAQGGSTSPVLAVADDGCDFLKWTDDSGAEYTANPFVLNNVSGNVTFTAHFQCAGPETWTVNFTAGSGGTLQGAVSQTVVNGGSASAVTAVPGAYCRFLNWTDTTGWVYTDNPLVVANVVSNMQLRANFTCDQTYTVKFTAGANGSLEGNLNQQVLPGQSATAVTAVPNAGYRFLKWTGDHGFGTSNQNPLVIANVNSDFTLIAQFTGANAPNPPNPLPVDVDSNGRTAMTPTLKVANDYFDPNNCGLLKTRWQVALDHGMTQKVLDITTDSSVLSANILDLYLEPNVMYHWRARFENKCGAVSDWSSISMFTTGTNPKDPNDTGIENDQRITDASIDMNKNGVPDRSEMGDNYKAVKVLLNTVEGGVIGVGKVSSNVNRVWRIKWVNASHYPPLPAKTIFPWGAVLFKLEMANPGDTAQVRLYFSKPVPADAVIYAYDQNAGWVKFTNITFNPDRLTAIVTLTDGGTGDGDHVANGVILNLIGFAITPVQPVEPGEEGSDNCFIQTAVGGISSSARSAVALLALAGMAAWLGGKRRK